MNPTTREIESIHAEQDAQEARTRPSAREHYEREAALAEPINALEAVMRLFVPLADCYELSEEEHFAIAHARQVLKRWGKV